jgi:hypothetical protein
VRRERVGKSGLVARWEWNESESKSEGKGAVRVRVRVGVRVRIKTTPLLTDWISRPWRGARALLQHGPGASYGGY